MSMGSPGVTEMLTRWRAGDASAADRVLGLVYDELRSVAGRHLRRETPGHTLQPTALVHEVWLRLMTGGVPDVRNGPHFIAILVRLMRQVLVNHALRRDAAKRGGRWRRVGLEPTVAAYESRCLDLLALDDALRQLGRVDPRLVHVVELRFFGGLTVAEAARVLDCPVRDVERDWSLARAWLGRELVS